MYIVTARVHRVDHVAGDRVLLLRARCIRQARLFFDRQAVHVRPHHDERTFAIFHDCHDTRTADAFSNLEARKAQFQRHATCRFVFDGRQFRVSVKVIEQALKMLIVVLLDYSTQVLCHRRSGK